MAGIDGYELGQKESPADISKKPPNPNDHPITGKAGGN